MHTAELTVISVRMKCPLGSRYSNFSPAAGVLEVKPTGLAPDIELGEAQGSTANRETRAFEATHDLRSALESGFPGHSECYRWLCVALLTH
jgi:hypothetical protein